MSAPNDLPTPPVLLTRSEADGRETLNEYVALGGYEALRAALESADPNDLIATVTDSGLTGRGGAGFPTGVKWGLAAKVEADQKYVVANGGEHEPGSRKDRVLTALRPHAILEGMALCGFATGASKGYLYLIEDMAESLASAEAALEEARAGGFLGDAVCGSSFAFDVEIHRAPTTYVAGEETAALESIEGNEAKPRKKPPYPGEFGLWGKPTTVNNTETLAHVPGILRHGAEWFRGLGVEGSAGTMLFTLPDNVNNPGVYELPYGATFRDLIYGDGKGGGLKSGKALKAILPAASSSWLGAEALDMAMDRNTLKAAGSGLGCGGLTILEEGDSIVATVDAIAQFFMQEQCGQCSPCRMLTNTYAALIGKVVAGEAVPLEAQMEKVAKFAFGKGACSLIEMAAAPVRSAVALFPEEFGVAAN
ncbi:MAG: NADH-ubiquinone oxidoreductase-F iron-sulfur binding region domain-containing protein [Planctomycetota bacterium]|jgi:NADH-quinone oxidoreductase subunit F